MIHDFNQKFQFSLGEREKFDKNVLKNAICGCVRIEKTDEKLDVKVSIIFQCCAVEQKCLLMQRPENRELLDTGRMESPTWPWRYGAL